MRWWGRRKKEMISVVEDGREEKTYPLMCSCGK
jgi:hypothetical protein